MFDLITIGRISVDIYGQEAGHGLADDQSFRKAVGGSPTNVAIGTARYGHRTAVVTGVGDDAFGKYALAELEKFKVSREFVITAPGKTPVVIAGLKDPDNPELVFYRDATAPDTQVKLTPELISAVEQAQIFWYTGSALADLNNRETVLGLLAARRDKREAENIFDLDYRPSFWRDEATATQIISGAVKSATVIIGNRKECSVASGISVDKSLDSFADYFLSSGARLAIIKDGANGVLVATRDGRSMIPGLKIKVRCGLGAGDAFGAGVVHGILSGWSPEESVKFANAAGAYVAGELMCSDAMPNESQVRELLARQ